MEIDPPISPVTGTNAAATKSTTWGTIGSLIIDHDHRAIILRAGLTAHAVTEFDLSNRSHHSRNRIESTLQIIITTHHIGWVSATWSNHQLWPLNLLRPVVDRV